MWHPSLYRALFPARRYAWFPIRILKETDKAILVSNCAKTWISKTWIKGIRLRGASFEIYIKEGTLV